jgi:uncharacterized protein YbjT (DUF2867 family)
VQLVPALALAPGAPRRASLSAPAPGNGVRVRVMVTGATGFVGGALARRLIDDGFAVRCLVRDPTSERARALEERGCELAVADLTKPGDLAGKLAGAELAYFLVHMLDSGADYADKERAAAARFAREAKRAGTRRIIYLGGLGEQAGSPHLRSRREVAAALEAEGPPLTYFRAAMVIGRGSESYELLRGIADRLPALPAPEWLHTETQPIGIDDAVSYLREAIDVSESAGREIQIGGPEVITHLDLVSEMAKASGRSGPRRIAVSDRVARPRAVAAGAAAVTAGAPEVARELGLGLAERTVVTDPSGAELFATRPRPLAETLGRAIDDQESVGAAG